jgi:hypothetical protein
MKGAVHITYSGVMRIAYEIVIVNSEEVTLRLHNRKSKENIKMDLKIVFENVAWI